MRNLDTTEKSILGHFIMSADGHTTTVVNQNWFKNSLHREIFNAFRNEHSVNVALLADAFGEAAISDCVKESCGYSGIKRAVKAVAEDFTRRQAVAAMRRGVELISKGGSISEAVDMISKAADDPSGIERTRSLADMIKARYLEIEAISMGEKEQNTYLKTGYLDFDARIGGYATGDLTVVGGRPSMGKTSWCLGSASHQAINGKRILWFNMDSSESSIVDRLFANHGHIDLMNLRQCKPIGDDWAKMAAAMNDLIEVNFSVDSTPGLTIEKLTSIARRENSKRHVDVLYVDYLQQLAGDGNEYERVTKASSELKRLANELQCAVVGLVQLNRGVEDRADKKPLLSDLRSSGQIEQDAFMVLFPYREEVYSEFYRSGKYKDKPTKGRAELLIRKHKDGPTGEQSDSYTFDERCATYRNLARVNFDD